MILPLQRITARPRIAWKRPGQQTAEAIGRQQLEIVVYDRCCRIGGTLTLDDLAGTEVGDWMMPQFRNACAYAASQGWLIAGRCADADHGSPAVIGQGR